MKRLSYRHHLPITGIITDLEVERSTFSHISMLVIEGINERLLMITLTPFVSEFSVSTADVFTKPLATCLVNRGSFDAKSSLLLFIIHVSAFEFPVVQMHVTISPGHADCLSQSIEVMSV